MLSFIKVFFQGILYVLLSPFLLLALILNLIYAIVIYFIYEVKSVFLFFSGTSYQSDDEETRRLKEIKNDLATKQFQQPFIQQPFVQQQPFVSPNINEINNNEDGGENNV